MADSQRFRKKPVVVEVIQWRGWNTAEVADFLGTSPAFNLGPDAETVDIHTLEGVMRAAKGDWIIRGVKGEFYPCKPDIFAATYEDGAQEADPRAEIRDLRARLAEAERARDGLAGALMYALAGLVATPEEGYGSVGAESAERDALAMRSVVERLEERAKAAESERDEAAAEAARLRTALEACARCPECGLLPVHTLGCTLTERHTSIAAHVQVARDALATPASAAAQRVQALERLWSASRPYGAPFWARTHHLGCECAGCEMLRAYDAMVALDGDADA